MQGLLLYMALGMAAAGQTGPAAVDSPSRGMRQRLLIVLQDLPDGAPADVRQQRLELLARNAGLPAGARLLWLRRQAIGGEVVQVTGVAPGQLETLVQALARQRAVSRIEIDGRAGIGPGPRLPRAEDRRR